MSSLHPSPVPVRVFNAIDRISISGVISSVTSLYSQDADSILSRNVHYKGSNVNQTICDWRVGALLALVDPPAF